MRLDSLPATLKRAGLNVVTTPGWKTRGADFAAAPKVVVAHHTASRKGSGNIPALGILVNGRSDLPGPLCQIGLARDGTCYVVAAGKANHAGPGKWRGIVSSALTIGIEAENDGVGEPWPDAQLDAYDRCAAALLRLLGQPAAMLCGHKEWAIPTGRKIDPHGIDMAAMRRRVARLLDEEEDMVASSSRQGLTEKDIARIWGYQIGDEDDELADRADRALLNALKRIKNLEAAVAKVDAEVAKIKKG